MLINKIGLGLSPQNDLFAADGRERLAGKKGWGIFIIKISRGDRESEIRGESIFIMISHIHPP